MTYGILKPVSLIAILFLMATALGAAPTGPGTHADDPIDGHFPNTAEASAVNASLGGHLDPVLGPATPIGDIFSGNFTNIEMPNKSAAISALRDRVIDDIDGVWTYYLESDNDVKASVSLEGDLHILSLQLPTKEVILIVDGSDAYLGWDFGNGYNDQTGAAAVLAVLDQSSHPFTNVLENLTNFWLQ